MPPVFDEQEVFNYFEKKGNLIDALVISGGEPTLWGDELMSFSKRFKKIFPDRFLKLDTNGSDPGFLKKAAKLYDYVAMDFKACDYSSFSSTSMDVISESLGLLCIFDDYEVRITLYPKYIDEKSLKIMIDMLKLHRVSKLSLQQYRKLNEVNPYSREQVMRFKDYAESAGFFVVLKGL